LQIMIWAAWWGVFDLGFMGFDCSSASLTLTPLSQRRKDQ
jgi:hypothetical protein